MLTSVLVDSAKNLYRNLIAQTPEKTADVSRESERSIAKHTPLLPSYDDLVGAQGRISKFSNDKYLYSNNDYFMQAMKRNPDGEKPNAELEGWKVHVSIDETDTAKAYNLISPLLQESGVYAYKVANPETCKDFAQKGPQQGKQITIYLDYSDIPVKDLLKKIEKILSDNNIKKGLPVNGDKPIDGSYYMHKRCDRDPYGNYVPAAIIEKKMQEKIIKPEMAYNPYGRLDPMEDINIADIYKNKNPEIEKLKAHYTQSPLKIQTVPDVADMVQATYESSQKIQLMIDGKESVDEQSKPEFSDQKIALTDNVSWHTQQLDSIRPLAKVTLGYPNSR